MVGRPARLRTWALGTLSLHIITRIPRRLRMWKLFSFRSCLAYVVHVSLPHKGVLMMHALYTATLVATVNLGFSYTRVVSRPNIVAVLPMRWLISASSDRLSLIVEPR